MALTLETLEAANALDAEIKSLEEEIAKLDLFAEALDDIPNDRYKTTLVFKLEEVNAATTITEIEGDEDTVPTLISVVTTTRTYLQTTRDTKWAEFQALCPAP